MPLSFVTTIAQSPSDSKVLLVGGQGHCSETWLVVERRHLSFRPDSGATWASVMTSTGVRDITFHPTDANLVYAQVASKGVYRSTDAGVTWRRLENGLPIGSAASYGRIVMAPSDPLTLYALLGPSSGATLKLYVTTDGGDSWTLVNGNACEGQCYYNNDDRCTPDRSAAVFSSARSGRRCRSTAARR